MINTQQYILMGVIALVIIAFTTNINMKTTQEQQQQGLDKAIKQIDQMTADNREIHADFSEALTGTDYNPGDTVIDTTVGSAFTMGTALKNILQIVFVPFGGIPLTNNGENQEFERLMAFIWGIVQSIIVSYGIILFYDKFKNRKQD